MTFDNYQVNCGIWTLDDRLVVSVKQLYQEIAAGEARGLRTAEIVAGEQKTARTAAPRKSGEKKFYPQMTLDQ